MMKRKHRNKIHEGSQSPPRAVELRKKKKKKNNSRSSPKKNRKRI
jgi:hypothetical protein